MKHTVFIIVFLYSFQSICCQESFSDIYSQVITAENNYYNKKQAAELLKNADEKESQQTAETIAYRKQVAGLLKKIPNSVFPDINFTDINGKVNSLYDLKGEVVVNYNYMFCSSCIDKIDLTVEKTKNKKTTILVLFADMYKKDFHILKSYNERVVIGFITDDTKDFISLKQGDDLMYYLDEEYRIEFCDHHNDESWIKFLDKHTQ